MQRLTKLGLLRSIRGPGGGFLQARPPAQIKLLEVYEAVEGPLEPQDCVFSLADREFVAALPRDRGRPG